MGQERAPAAGPARCDEPQHRTICCQDVNRGLLRGQRGSSNLPSLGVRLTPSALTPMLSCTINPFCSPALPPTRCISVWQSWGDGNKLRSCHPPAHSWGHPAWGGGGGSGALLLPGSLLPSEAFKASKLEAPVPSGKLPHNQPRSQPSSMPPVPCSHRSGVAAPTRHHTSAPCSASLWQLTGTGVEIPQAGSSWGLCCDAQCGNCHNFYKNAAAKTNSRQTLCPILTPL